LACVAGLSYKSVAEWISPVMGCFCAGLAYIIYNHFIKILIKPLSNDDAALLAESHYPEINNTLINSYQLSRHLKDPHFKNAATLELIMELQARTSKELNRINPSSVINQKKLILGRNWFLGALASLALTTILIPEFLTKGYDRWTNPKVLISHSQNEITNQSQAILRPDFLNYSIDSLDLSFYFPSYTRKKPERIQSSNGVIHALPGTEVDISIKTNYMVSEANLVFNKKDSLAMNKESAATLNANLLVKEKGFYQFKVKDHKGIKHLLETKYPVTLKKDQSPNIILFLANPKPVYFFTDKVQFFYEGRDDFGVSMVDLVVSINGKINRIPVKKYKNHEREVKDSFSWSLAQMNINPGDEISYYLEIKDNDNIFGPNKGHSEAYSFRIFDSEKEMENLVELQEELTEKMIALLATGLVKGVSLKEQPNNLIGWKQLLTVNIDELIKIVTLAQRIYEQGKIIDVFPQHYLNLLKNITRGLTEIRKNQIRSLSNIRNQMHEPTQANLKSTSPYYSVNHQMTEHLEKDILFLVKITNEQKLNKTKALEEKLNDLVQTLREDLEKSNSKKSAKTSKDLQTKINKIQKTLQKLMNQLSRQTQSMPDEFLNQNAFKRLNLGKLSDVLKKMQDMISRGNFEEAMEELKKMEEDLKLLANQIRQADSEKENFIDPETLKTIDNSIKKLDKLEKRQKNLTESTTQMNQKLRQQQTRKFEDQLDKLFKGLLNDIISISDIFREDEKFLSIHKTMNEVKGLVNKEIKITEKIKKLSQATIDSSHSQNLDQNFGKLKEARNKLSQLIEKKNSLRVKEAQQFKETLPQLLGKYGSLNKLAKAQDLNEFANVFNQVYPNVLKWQYKIRSAPNLREDISNKLENDLTQASKINNSISKKLGTMIRSIRKNYTASITENQKKELIEMEKKERQIRKESQKISQQFNDLSKKNPLIPSELSQGMKQTERYMKQAESNLRKQNIRESIESENKALRGLSETRELLSQIRNSNGETKQAKKQNARKLGTGSSPDSRQGGATRMQKERIMLPDETQYRAPKEFREEILNAMKKRTPKDYERMVMEYYRDLVK